MTAAIRGTKTRKRKEERLITRFVAILQKLGKALLYPVAILPFAAIFLRFSTEIPGGETAPLFAQ